MIYELCKNGLIISIILFSYILLSQMRLHIWPTFYILNETISFFIYLYLFLYYFFITLFMQKLKNKMNKCSKKNYYLDEDLFKYF